MAVDGKIKLNRKDITQAEHQSLPMGEGQIGTIDIGDLLHLNCSKLLQLGQRL